MNGYLKVLVCSAALLLGTGCVALVDVDDNEGERKDTTSVEVRVPGLEVDVVVEGEGDNEY